MAKEKRKIKSRPEAIDAIPTIFEENDTPNKLESELEQTNPTRRPPAHEVILQELKNMASSGLPANVETQTLLHVLNQMDIPKEAFDSTVKALAELRKTMVPSIIREVLDVLIKNIELRKTEAE